MFANELEESNDRIFRLMQIVIDIIITKTGLIQDNKKGNSGSEKSIGIGWIY